MKVLGTIVRWFTLGAIAGLMVAPRAGHETRALISDKFNHLVDGYVQDDGATTEAPSFSSGQSREVHDITL